MKVQKLCQFLFSSIIFQKDKQNIETELNVVPSKLKIFCHQKNIFFIVNASFKKIAKVNCSWIEMVNQKSVNLWETTLCLMVFWCFKQICTFSKQIIESIRSFQSICVIETGLSYFQKLTVCLLKINFKKLRLELVD